MAALQEMAQAVAGLFERIEKFVDTLDVIGDLSGVEIGDQFVAKVGGAANTLGEEQGNNFRFIAPLQLKFPKLLNGQSGGTKRINGVTEFVQHTEVNAF